MHDPLPRLSHADPGVRRIAVLDLARDTASNPALIDRLAVERDERTAILIIRALEERGGVAAMPALWNLYSETTTPVRVAHAAILAHDTIAGRQRNSAK
jgi:hypothetical protein